MVASRESQSGKEEGLAESHGSVLVFFEVQ
jgi:hypothetical protein